MPRPAPLVRASLMGFMLTTAPLGLGLTTGTAHASQASTDEPSAASETEGPSWGAILGACFGVLFGGALALWQIRGMKDRG